MKNKQVIVEFHNCAPFVYNIISDKEVTIDKVVEYLKREEDFDEEKDNVQFVYYTETIPLIDIGHTVSWKFGIITRDIYRTSKNRYIISDTSDGWKQVTVTYNTLCKLLNGKKSLENLKWK